MLTSRIPKVFSLIFFLLIIFISSSSYGFDRRFSLTTNNGLYSLDIKLPEGYKIYWLNSGDSGQPTVIDLSRSSNIANYDLLWPFPEQETSNHGKINSFVYKGNVSIPLVIQTINQSKPVDLKIDLNYLVCSDQCYKIDQAIERQISVIDKNPLMNHMSINNIHYDSGILAFDAEFTRDIENEDLKIILMSDGEILQYDSLITHIDDSYHIIFNIPYSIYSNLIGKEFQLYSNNAPIPSESIFPEGNMGFYQTPLYITILLSIVGGFMLNFMPCVLPVLALKMMAVNKMGENYRRSLSITIAGIICSFWLLSILSITMKDIGIGLGFQNSEFLIILTILIVIFISIAIGRINLTLPRFIYDVSVVKFAAQYIEDFMGGVVATMLSVPCTAPFLGGAMAAAILGSSLDNFIIFTSISIGFSLPYILLIISMRFLSFMPKSGKWTQKIKTGLAILLIASLMWIISILYNSLGIRGTIGLTMILLLIKYIIEEKNGIFSKVFLKLSVFSALLFAAIYLPEMAHKQDLSYEKYIDSIWQEFDATKIDDHVKSGKIVVVDITADWCLTCKFNKIRLWDRSNIVTLLRAPSIVAMRADITKQNLAVEQFLLENNVYGIPFNIIYGPKAPKGIVLPVIPNYEDLRKAIEEAR